MIKVNVALEDDNHHILSEYQRLNKLPNRDAAVNAMIKEFGQKSQLFR